MSDLLDKAMVFAVKAHSNMLRKGTSTTYILHPLEAAVVATVTADEEVIAAAVLHDVTAISKIIAVLS